MNLKNSITLEERANSKGAVCGKEELEKRFDGMISLSIDAKA